MTKSFIQSVRDYDAAHKPVTQRDSSPVTVSDGGGWAETALANEVNAVITAHLGTRNATLNTAAFNLGQIVAGGHLDQAEVETALWNAARQNGLDDDENWPTLQSGLSAGMSNPRHPPERDPIPAVTTIATPSPESVTLDEAPKRMRDGAAFILDAPDKVPTIWGDADDVLWAQGEALMVVGPPGVGKTTLTGQLLRARLGLGNDHVLGYPVGPTDGVVLYLAMDRPAQIARALRRTFTETERAHLSDHLKVWEGPPPADIAKRPEILPGLASLAGADTIILDSLKDAAIGLSEDEVAASYNRARQMCLADGIQVLELHHLTKHGPNGAKPTTLADVYGSAWLTAGAGSVLLLWGQAGDPIVGLTHLKQPAGEVGPFRVIHNHEAGTTERYHGTDLLTLAQATGQAGLTAQDAACALFSKGKASPNEVEKARRRLDQLADKGLVERIDGHRGGNADTRAPTVWRAITGAVTVLSVEEGNHASSNQSSETDNRRSDKPRHQSWQSRARSYHEPPPLYRGGE